MAPNTTTGGKPAPDLHIKLRDDAIAGFAHPDGYDVMPGESAVVPAWLGLQLLGTGRATLVKEGDEPDFTNGDPSVTTPPAPNARRRRS
jgi:hypothetical protein